MIFGENALELTQIQRPINTESILFSNTLIDFLRKYDKKVNKGSFRYSRNKGSSGITLSTLKKFQNNFQIASISKLPNFF